MVDTSFTVASVILDRSLSPRSSLAMRDTVTRNRSVPKSIAPAPKIKASGCASVGGKCDCGPQTGLKRPRLDEIARASVMATHQILATPKPSGGQLATVVSFQQVGVGVTVLRPEVSMA